MNVPLNCDATRSWTRGWIDLHLYAMASAALLTGVLLWWTNASWRESFEAYPPVLDKLRLVRADTVKGYLAVERHMAGEQLVRLPDVDAFFEQAINGCDDIAQAMGIAEHLPRGSAASSAFLATLAQYASAIGQFRDMARQGVSADAASLKRYGVERQVAFAALEKMADTLDDEVQRRIGAAAKRQDRLNNVLFFVWLSFLAFLAASLVLAGARRRKAEQAMVASEEKYRSLFDQIRDVILVVEQDTGRILDCNRAVVSEWGYEPSELVGKTSSLLGLPEGASLFGDAAARCGPAGSPTAVGETRLVVKSGEMRDVSIRSGLFSLGTTPVRLDIFRDVTELKKDESALREREAMLRSLGDNLPDGVIYTLEIAADGSRRFLYISQGLEHILGLPVAKALFDANAVFDLINPEDRDRLRQAESEALAGGTALDIQARVISRDGSQRWGQFRAAPRPAEGGFVLFDGVYFDVSDQKRIEEHLRQAKAEAEAASRAKSEFLANISHEVRTPLNGVLGMLQLLETASLTEEEANYVATALGCGRGLVRVLADILDFSLLDAGAMALKDDHTDVRAIVAEVLEVLGIECRNKGLATKVEVAADVPPRLLVDAARLRQILFNVVGNAVKFTQAGSVSVSVSVASRLGETITLLCTVADTGIGMPESQLDAIFEPFTQVDGSLTRKYGGTGLGLGIVKRLTSLLGGHMAVESRQGVGTRFDIAIPCRLSQPATLQPPVLPLENPGPPGTRVLVVEDDAVNRMATVIMLKKMGFAVEAVEDGDRVLETLAGKPFDVVLMDIQMPRVSGDEATRRIRQGVHPGVDAAIPVIAVTAHAMDGDRERYLDSGMDDYLSKPVDVAALRDAVLRAVAARRNAPAA